MPYSIKYYPEVFSEDIPKLDEDVKSRIKNAIETKLASAPADFGLPLRRTLNGCWKLRVGDYRIVFKMQGNELHILCIGHRKEIYRQAAKRVT